MLEQPSNGPRWAGSARPPLGHARCPDISERIRLHAYHVDLRVCRYRRGRYENRRSDSRACRVTLEPRAEGRSRTRPLWLLAPLCVRID